VSFSDLFRNRWTSKAVNTPAKQFFSVYGFVWVMLSAYSNLLMIADYIILITTIATHGCAMGKLDDNGVLD
jgi:hypothetical protein